MTIIKKIYNNNSNGDDIKDNNGGNGDDIKYNNGHNNDGYNE